VRPHPPTSLKTQYLQYFECFNQGRYFQAHEVLEDLWLAERGTERADFFKALIQLAGAFVHLEKGRLSPALALLKLARGYLEKYPERYEHWDTTQGLALIQDWLIALEFDRTTNPLSHRATPQLSLPHALAAPEPD
jgi:predicted metal-dependent hydrolase